MTRLITLLDALQQVHSIVKTSVLDLLRASQSTRRHACGNPLSRAQSARQRAELRMGSATHTAFVWLTILSSVFVRISPFPDFYRVHKQRATGEVQILPVVMLGTNCWVLSIYAYMVDDILPLFVVAVSGILTALVFIAVFYRWSDDRPQIHRVCAMSACFLTLATTYTILATSGVTNQSRTSIQTVTGWITIVAAIGLFASPLATIRRVLRNKSAASMPFTMCVANTINAILWAGFAIVDDDMFVLAPNVVGSALGIIQVVLCVVYRPKTSSETQIVSVPMDGLHNARTSKLDEDASISVVLMSPQPQMGHVKCTSETSKSPTFAAMQSPAPRR